MRPLLQLRNRHRILLVGVVLVLAMVLLFLPSTNRYTFGATKRSFFEVEGIQCPRSLAPHDGLGVQRRLPQALVIGAMKSGTGNVEPSIHSSIHMSTHSCILSHYSDVIMGTIASQIASLTIVYSMVYSDADHRNVTGLCASSHQWLLYWKRRWQHRFSIIFAIPALRKE